MYEYTNFRYYLHKIITVLLFMYYKIITAKVTQKLCKFTNISFVSKVALYAKIKIKLR